MSSLRFLLLRVAVCMLTVSSYSRQQLGVSAEGLETGWSGGAGGGGTDSAPSDQETELDILYHDCDLYKTDLFGGTVCGTDGKTYRNSVHLACSSHQAVRRGHRGEQVGVASEGPCPGELDTDSPCPWSPYYKPVCGSDGVTYTNKEWLKCCTDNSTLDLSVASNGQCSVEDPCTATPVDHSRAAPVCASNGLTYRSVEEVACLQSHPSQSDLEILHEGGCTVEEVTGCYPDRGQICSLSRHHHEYNPLCQLATNRTYTNPFVYLCSSPSVGALTWNGRCDSETVRSCRKALQVDRQLEECRKHSKSLLQEVCGNDGLTYRTVDHLNCAAKNNSQLEVLHPGACRREDSPCLRASNLTRASPVCGTDHLTYSSFVALSCIAKSSHSGLKYLHRGPCLGSKSSTRLSHPWL